MVLSNAIIFISVVFCLQAEVTVMTVAFCAI